jgi:hypothetical protein
MARACTWLSQPSYKKAERNSVAQQRLVAAWVLKHRTALLSLFFETERSAKLTGRCPGEDAMRAQK